MKFLHFIFKWPEGELLKLNSSCCKLLQVLCKILQRSTYYYCISFKGCVTISFLLQAMETCVACLLHTPHGQLMQPARMLELLDSDAKPLLRYLSWSLGVKLRCLCKKL